MAGKLSIQDLPLQGKRVLLRVDFNVPLEKNAMISDDSRIQAALPSIRYALDHGAALVLMSHLGRPKGIKNPSLSLAPCAKRLSDLLGQPVPLAPDCVGPEVERMVSGVQPGGILLLENLRFHDAEEHPEKDPSFAEKLSHWGDVYVDDAFGAAHRPHASITEIAQYFPGKAAQGLLMQKELAYLGTSLTQSKRPFYAILGGAKISTKIGLIRTLCEKVDGLFVGGAMAFTFLKAQGRRIGSSLFEEDFLGLAKEVLAHCEKKRVKFWLPLDAIIVRNESPMPAEGSVVTMAEGIPDGYQGVDIGPATIREFQNGLQDARTIFWNGPMGIFERDAFAKGTLAIAQTVAATNALKIVGGGDSVAALHKLGLADKMSHLSTGGGASLEFIEKGKLVGVEALSEKRN